MRWTRYGHDRLYVKTLAGDAVGWGDVRTGSVTVTQQSLADELYRALAEHPLWPWAGRAPVAGDPMAQGPTSTVMGAAVAEDAEAVVLVPLDASAPDEPAWTDLALVRAGAAARAQAVAAREAAPVRTLAARLLGVPTEERAWRVGADGEEKVAARLVTLAKKDPRWRFLHAVPVGTRGSDIDHVVVGPGGIFTLNAKHHPGAKVWVSGDRFLVNGHYQRYVRNSRHEAARASELLSAAVGRPVIATGVIVPVGADSLTVKEQPADVWVVARKQIHRWLAACRPVLSEAEIAGIFDAARRSTTWMSFAR